jgi:hypothetical protein
MPEAKQWRYEEIVRTALISDAGGSPKSVCGERKMA